MDMIGNAWEWTSTEWKGYPGGPVPPDASNELRVIRGGYWGSSPPKATTTFRRGWPARNAENGYKNTGFRCAADVTAQAK
jgi:formylglycine-generating enzyme required for sulfatase activity